MTCHALTHKATNKCYDRKRQSRNPGCKHPSRSSMLDESLSGSTSHLTPLAPSLPDDAPTEPDNLIDALVREQLSYIEALEFLGFGYETSVSILRCWIALQMNAPMGGPYDLLGVALAAIAELGEMEMRDCRGNAAGYGSTLSRSEWQTAFAQILNYEALAAIGRVGVYLAPDFTKAKWLVYHMVLRRWRKLVGRMEAA